jgi:branched-chain amino acid transport system ATP-binding protein
MALLETINLCKYFGGLKANHNISLQVEAGQIYGLIGPNGAGKTTFLNAISGVSPATSGQIFFDGEDVTNAKSYEMCQKGLARTFQIVRSFRDLSVLENVVVGAIFGAGLSRAEAEKAAVKNLEFVNFPLDYNTKASALNTIQLKKVEMARALSCGCKMLLLDEVAAGLTPFELSEIAQLIKRIRDDLGITIIIVEHLMKLIMDVCDELAVLYFGELLATGTPSEVSANEKVIKAYLGDNYML